MGHGQPPRPRTVPRLNNKPGLIRMDDRPFAFPERGARVTEHAVGQCRVRARADRPRDRQPVVAVDDRRQVRLARRNAELGQVRDPQHVRLAGMEITVHKVLRRFRQLALVRAVPFRALIQGHQAVRGHEPHDAFGRHSDVHALELEVDALVTVTTPAVLERLAHELQQGGVPVGLFHGVEDNARFFAHFRIPGLT